jgi:pyruvate dehydrogenase (quinone)
MPRVLEMAIQTARSRRGVSVIVLPGDVALSKATESPRLEIPEPTRTVSPSDQDLTRLATALDAAERITILGGAGCAGAMTS